MACSDYRELISALIDGELEPVERLRAESHLRECSGCRRYRKEIDDTARMVRGLDRLEAPRFVIHRSRLRAAGRANRAQRWEMIRSRTLPKRQPTMRPILFGAVAVVLIMVAIQLAQQADDIPLSPAPSPGVADSTPAPGAETGERPEWLKREIARRVQESRDAAEEAGTTDPSSTPPTEEPLVIAQATPTPGPAGSGGTASAAGGEMERPVTSPEMVLTVPPSEMPSSPPSTPAEVNRISAGRPAETPLLETDPAEAPEAGAGGAVEPTGTDSRDAERPVRVTVLTPTPQVGPPPTAPRPRADAVQADPTGAQARPASASFPGAPYAAPPADVRALRMVAVVSADEEAETLAFLDAHEAAESRAAGKPAAAEAMPEEGAFEERPVPEPDPRTGIVPPVLRERAKLDLDGRLSEAREQELMVPLAIRLTVDPEGEVTDAAILHSSGLTWLDEEVLEAVGRWTFHPAERAGDPIAATLEVVIEFEID